MVVTHDPTGKPFATKYAHTVNGSERETVDGRTTYHHQLEAFRDAVVDGVPAPTGGADSIATMELIDQRDYGYCEACGIEIGIQRLEARPTATQCIDCKTLAEIKEKQELG